MSSLPSGTVTFLFTDIEGSTKLAQSLADKWQSLRARHHEILKSAIESNNGYVFQVIGAAFNVILEKSNLAHLERRIGNHADALDYYRETILAFRDMGQNGAVSHQLECFGFIALEQNQADRALQLFAAASALREKAGTTMRPEEKAYFDQQMRRVRDKMESPTLDLIWSRGHTLSMDHAIALALEESQ
jgi:class 3 adenylate cyclase